MVRLITQESKKQDSLNSQTTGTRQPTNQRLQNRRENSKGACLQRGGKYLNTKVGRGTRVFSVCRRTTGAASPFPLSLFSKHGSNPNEGLISLVRSLVESRAETSPTFSRWAHTSTNAHIQLQTRARALLLKRASTHLPLFLAARKTKQKKEQH